MPIAFPLPLRGPSYNSPAIFFKKVPGIQVAPNLARPGVPFKDDFMDPGIPLPKAWVNLRRLGLTYADVAKTAVVNPVNTVRTDRRVYDRVQASLNMLLSGVTYDTNSAVLGNCRVMIFRTGDNSFVGETTSDASGIWSFPILKGGPFFRVVYKPGSPDVFGTSVNTIVPVQV